MFKAAACLILVFISTSAFSQKADSSFQVFRDAESELFVLQQTTFNSRKENERFESNKKFIGVWDRIVADPRILDYKFEHLKEISILRPPDNKFMLITWNVPKDDGTHAYFGYLLVNNKKKIKKSWFKSETENTYENFKLIDRSATVRSPESYVGSPEKWFGMLYTQMVPCDGYYMLIGWDGNDKLIQRKFIDVLYFNSAGKAFFGKDVFKFPRKNPRRLMFEYSSEVAMSLKYNPKENMIVFSELGPDRHGTVLEGQFQYYGPTGNFNGLEQRKSKWVLVEDVNSNSTIKPTPESKKPNPKKQSPVYKP